MGRREADIATLERELEAELAQADEEAVLGVAKDRAAAAKQRMLKATAQESAALRMRVQQRYLQRKRQQQAQRYGSLCELERSVKRKASAFVCAIGRLCQFEVDVEVVDENQQSEGVG